MDGVVFKSIDSSALVRTVREVIGGARPGFNADTKESVLSPKELEVLQFLAKGMNSKDIAEAMFITVNTVKSHRSHIMRKLGAANAADMVMKAVTLGLIPRPGCSSTSGFQLRQRRKTDSRGRQGRRI